MQRFIVGLLIAVAFIVGIAGPAAPSTLASPQGAVSAQHDALAYTIGARALLDDAVSRPPEYPMPVSFVLNAIRYGTPVYRVSGPRTPTYGIFTGIVWPCDTSEVNGDTCFAGQVTIGGEKHWTTGT